MTDILINYPLGVLVAFIAIYFALDYLFPAAMNVFEETVIAVLLALMTLTAFVQVVLRYGFNSGIQGALELNRILFAWLILFGMSYGIKVKAHLGIDSLVSIFPPPVFKAFAIFAALASALYGIVLITADWLDALGATTRGGGAVDYWQRMFRVGIGLDDLMYPNWLVDLIGMVDRNGEPMTNVRVHRWVAYLILPVGLGLFVMRSLQALVDIVRGRRPLIIASHEAEDLVAENRNVLKD